MIYPTIRPSLTLNFQGSQQLDPRISFSRSSSATYINSAGMVAYAAEHEARFEDEGLLIEESRTNFIKNSTAIQIAQSNCSVALSVGPDGTNTATTATSSANGTFTVNANPNRGTVWTSSTSTTWSCYLKSSQISSYRIDLVDGAGQGGITVSNITTDPVFSNIASRITNYDVQEIPGGWYRFWVVFDSTLNNTSGMAMRVSAYDGLAGNSFQIGGEQCEIGSFPTSLIPTAGSTVTRAQDIATITGNNFTSWWNQSEGTQYADYTSLDPSTSTQQALFLAIGPNANYARGFKVFQPNPTVSPESYYQVLDSVQLFNKSLPLGKRNAGAYKQDDYAFANENGFVDGITVAGTLSTPMTKCRINSSQTGNGSPLFIFSGHIARLAYYSERLTDIQLEAITL